MRQSEHGLALVGFKTVDSYTVYAKQQCFKGWFNILQVSGSFDNAALKSGSVGDFEQWVDIVDEYLPEPEDVDKVRMQG